MTGKYLLPKPELNRHYTADEIAKELGATNNRIGRIANSMDLKTDEYGKYVLTEVKHDNGSVYQGSKFLYNEDGKAKIIKFYHENFCKQ